MAKVTQRLMPGGPLAIDLINTTWRTVDGHFDWLDEDASVQAFFEEYHPRTASDITAVRSALVQVRGLARRLLDNKNEPFGLVGDLTVEVNTMLESARAVVLSTSDGPTVAVTGDQVTNRLAIEALVNAIDLRREHPNRVRSCKHDDCILWFLDTSRSGRRLWCSMNRCGNRAKAQRHYKRSTRPST